MSLPAIQMFKTSTGARIYRLPMRVFSNSFFGYSHLILDAGPPTLVDCGSGMGQSNDDLLAGLQAVHEDFGEAIAITDIERIIVTHGHFDHYGGVSFMVGQIGEVQVGIHPLERRVLTNHEERLIIATKDVRVYLERAGIEEPRRSEMVAMYGYDKRMLQSVDVHFSLQEDMILDGMRFIHVPGHCPGHVCILMGDTLLSADHVLSKTTPHQAPESITHYMGLGHYRDSLRKIQKVEGVKLAIGGHEDPMTNFYTRIDEIMQSHDRKLNRVLDIIREADAPCTIDYITRQMYPDKIGGYNQLLTLEEAGAHVEYLYEFGTISVANLEEVAREDNPALRYKVSS